MRPIHMLQYFALLLVVMILSCCSKNEQRYVDDRVELFSSAQTERLEQFHDLLLREQDVHFTVVTLGQAADNLDQRTLELFEELKVGSLSKTSLGLLMVVDIYNQQVRIEVGYGLEEVFPDGFIAALQYDQMLPFFRSDRVGHGIEALTEMLVDRLQQTSPSATAAQATDEPLSGGAGARISTSGDDPTDRPANEQLSQGFRPQPTPLATLQQYRDSLAARDKDPDLAIYTAETRAFFRNWVVTDAQQNNALSQLDADLPSAEVMVLGEFAVIRFPLDQRKASPYFLRRSPQGWQLDFATMSQTIRFNHRNQWHFMSYNHDYMDAFKDWKFDKNGFPHQKR